MLEQHLTQLMQDLEMDSFPSKDKEGLFQLMLNPETKISFKELEPGMFMVSPIKECPEKNREEVLTLMMRANFLGLGTGGSVIALDAEEKFLTLSIGLPYDMNYKEFKGIVEDFVNFLDYWKDELMRFEKK